MSCNIDGIWTSFFFDSVDESLKIREQYSLRKTFIQMDCCGVRGYNAQEEWL